MMISNMGHSICKFKLSSSKGQDLLKWKNLIKLNCIKVFVLHAAQCAGCELFSSQRRSKQFFTRFKVKTQDNPQSLIQAIDKNDASKGKLARVKYFLGIK